MYKFGKPLQYTLCEAPQPNPLRWELFYREKNTFTPQTAQFKCKDYLNDVVAKYRGHSVQVYGMNTVGFKLNETGVWLRLFRITNDDLFLENIQNTINVFYADTPEMQLTFEPVEDTLLMFVPKHFFDSSYKISLLSYLIRLANNTEQFKDFDSAFSSIVATKVDRAIQGNGVKLVKKWKFSVPEDYQQYWYYMNSEFNSSKVPAPMGGIIHNCGVMGWAGSIKV